MVEVSEILGFSLHPDKSRLGGIPSLLERCVGVLRDIRILCFFQEVRQYLDCRAEGVKAVAINQRY